MGLDAGPCQRGDLDARCDVACFTAAALEQPQRLCGTPQLSVAVQADQPGFDLSAVLSRVRPDGTVEQLSTGVLRQRGADCQVLQRRQVVLQPLLAELAAGDRLRLSLAGAAWPQIAVNPGDGSFGGAPGSVHRVITLSVELDDAQLDLLPLLARTKAQLGQTGRT